VGAGANWDGGTGLDRVGRGDMGVGVARVGWVGVVGGMGAGVRWGGGGGDRGVRGGGGWGGGGSLGGWVGGARGGGLERCGSLGRV